MLEKELANNDVTLNTIKRFNIRDEPFEIAEYPAFVTEMHHVLVPAYIGKTISKKERVMRETKYKAENKYLRDVWLQRGGDRNPTTFGNITFIGNAFLVECCAWGNPNESRFLRMFAYFTHYFEKLGVIMSSQAFSKDYVLAEKSAYLLLHASIFEHTLYRFRLKGVNVDKALATLYQCVEFLMLSPDVNTMFIKKAIGAILPYMYSCSTEGKFPKCSAPPDIKYNYLPKFRVADVKDFVNDCEFYYAISDEFKDYIEGLEEKGLTELKNSLEWLISAPIDKSSMTLGRMLNGLPNLAGFTRTSILETMKQTEEWERPPEYAPVDGKPRCHDLLTNTVRRHFRMIYEKGVPPLEVALRKIVRGLSEKSAGEESIKIAMLADHFEIIPSN
jgi:hypothetical protein